jgi:hypothetical protein
MMELRKGTILGSIMHRNPQFSDAEVEKVYGRTTTKPN